jgi:hypothetical protein
MTKRNVIIADNYDEFRELLPTSGVFDFTDCAVEILCPMQSETEEVERMVHLIESMVHVTDVKIGSDTESLISDSYRVIVVEDGNSIAKKRFIGEKE